MNNTPLKVRNSTSFSPLALYLLGLKNNRLDSNLANTPTIGIVYNTNHKSKRKKPMINLNILSIYLFIHSYYQLLANYALIILLSDFNFS
jgi:hypothetical protein